MSTGLIANLLSRLTPTRAANLDDLDAAITSRASAANWTSTRAGYLDAAITSRASAAALATTDAVCDAIKTKVDSDIDAAMTSRASAADLATVDALIDAIKLKTDKIVTQHRQAFSSSGTWPRPAGVYWVEIKFCGGGGGGDNPNGAGGGAAVVQCRVAVSSDLTITLAAAAAVDTNGAASSVTGTDVVLNAPGGGNGTGGGVGGGVTGAIITKGGDAGEDCPGYGLGDGGGGSWNDAPDISHAGTKGAGGGKGYAGGAGYCVITWEEY